MERIAVFAMLLAVIAGCKPQPADGPGSTAAGEAGERPATSTETEEGPAGSEAVVIADKLRVRAEGSLREGVVGVLKRGDVVEIRGEDRYDDDSGLVWAPIACGDVRGWAALDFMLRREGYEGAKAAERAARASLQPSRARARAVAAPIPELAPVMIATFPERGCAIRASPVLEYPMRCR